MLNFTEYIAEGRVIRDTKTVTIAGGGWSKIAAFMAKHQEVFVKVEVVGSGVYRVKLPDERLLMPRRFNVFDADDFATLAALGVTKFDLFYYRDESKKNGFACLPFGRRFGNRRVDLAPVIGHGITAFAKGHRGYVRKRMHNRDVDEHDVKMMAKFPSIFARILRVGDGWYDQERVDDQKPVTLTNALDREHMVKFLDLVKRAANKKLLEMPEPSPGTKYKFEDEILSSWNELVPIPDKIGPDDPRWAYKYSNSFTDLTGADIGPAHNVGYRGNELVFFDI